MKLVFRNKDKVQYAFFTGNQASSILLGVMPNLKENFSNHEGRSFTAVNTSAVTVNYENTIILLEGCTVELWYNQS